MDYSDRPNGDGWYWWRRDARSPWRMTQVDGKNETDFSLFGTLEMVPWYPGGQWWGPIPTPDEAKGGAT